MSYLPCMSRVFIGSNKGFLVDGSAKKGMTINGDLLVNGPIVGENAGVTLKANTLAVLSSSVIGSFDGQRAFVSTVKGYFNYATGSTRTADGRTVLTTKAGGNTRWVFDDNFSHPDWRLGRNHWYINPITGSDENDGLTSTTSIKTGAEFARRWGSQNIVQQSGSVNFSVNVHILGDIVAPDFLQVDCILEGDTEVQVFGEGTTTNYTSVGPTSLTTEVQTTNTPWAITDAAAAAQLVVGRRIRWTAGAAVGAVAWVAKSLGGNAFRISNTLISSQPDFGTIPTNKTPVVNDDYVVESLTRCNIGVIRVNQRSDTIAFPVFAYFNDLQIESSPLTLHMLNNGDMSLSTVSKVFNQCKFTCQIESWGCLFANCCFQPDGPLCFRKSTFVMGGLILGSSVMVEWQAQEEGQIQNDTYIQGTVGIWVGGMCTIGNCAIFDSVAGLGASGDGVVVGSPSVITSNIGPANLKISGRIWGSGNAGVGINVRSGCRASYSTTPNVTGTGGDFMLAGTVAAGYYFNAATGAYLPAGGQATTWALLAAAKAAPGYGGSAHELDKDAHLVLFA